MVTVLHTSARSRFQVVLTMGMPNAVKCLPPEDRLRKHLASCRHTCSFTGRPSHCGLQCIEATVY